MDARVIEFTVAEAAGQFAALLARAEAGEEIVLCRDGRAVAKLGPAGIGSKPVSDPQERERIVNEWREWRRDHGPRLGPDLTIRQLIEEGRKY